jgi:hypothetical protein
MANKITVDTGVSTANARTVRDGDGYEHKLRGPELRGEDGPELEVGEGQRVSPVVEEEEGEPSPGSSSSTSDESTEKNSEQTPSESPSTARSTAGRSNRGQTGSSTASSAGTASSKGRRSNR